MVSAGVDINERAPFGLCFMSAESLWHVVSSFLLFFFVESPDPKQTEEEVGGGDGDEAGGRREHQRFSSADTLFVVVATVAATPSVVGVVGRYTMALMCRVTIASSEHALRKREKVAISVSLFKY